MTRRLLTLVPLLTTIGCAAPPPAAPADPLAYARAWAGVVKNPEAGIPPACYTRTDGSSNPCWACHTGAQVVGGRVDWPLQEAYAFSEFARTNRWSNLFVDRRAAMARYDDAEMWAWIRTDNYTPLLRALADRPDYPGYRPDLDYAQGFDARGFANDGSGWRALRYKPFPGQFWPTNGSADDVFVRLPPPFRQDAEGRPSQDVYAENLDRLIQAMQRLPGEELPATYAGGAASVPLVLGRAPEGTELLHSVRYVDPAAPDGLGARMKELRYAKKVQDLDAWATRAAYDEDLDRRDKGLLPRPRGSAEVGLRNDLGWQLQGFIEDETGALRLQTDEEHRGCVSCHGGIGATIDSTFSLARKLPGAEGWAPQSLVGQQDAPMLGHEGGEVYTWLSRVGAADELRANGEALARLFPGGALDEAALARVAPGGDQDLAWLLMPSDARALELARAYRVIVEEQSFTSGRDALSAPAENVWATIDEEETALGRAGRVYADGQTRLAWGE